LSHKDKIASPRKSIYFLAAGAVLAVVLTVAANILVQRRIDVLYQEVYKSGMKSVDHISRARSLILINATEQSRETVRSIWDELDQAEVFATQLTNNEDRFSIVTFAVDTAPLNTAIQQLQILLLDYRALCSKVMLTSRTARSDSVGAAWHSKYGLIEEQNKI
jgi:hypothetical protein